MAPPVPRMTANTIALPAAAQDPVQERWFKVELMIFSHQAAPSGSEQWEPTPALAYPAEFRFLVEPELVAANMAAHPGESVVDEFGRQIVNQTSARLRAWEVAIDQQEDSHQGRRSYYGSEAPALLECAAEGERCVSPQLPEFDPISFV